MAKVRITASVSKRNLDEGKRLMKPAGCENISEYVRKAVEMYNEYILNPDADKFKTSIEKSVVKSTAEMHKHYERLAFKSSVMIAKLYGLIISGFNMKPEWSDEVHNIAVSDVKRIYGKFNFPEK